MAKVRVRYVGMSDVREINPSDVKPRGISLDRKLVWDRSNGFSLVVDANDEFEKVLREQEHFTLTSVDDDGNDVSVVATATNPEHQETVVAKEEGKATQKSAAK